MRSPTLLARWFPASLALACGGAGDAPEAPTCPPCPACEQPAEPAATTLEPWEAELLAPTVERLRAGIRPFGDAGFGVCRGRRTCEEFLGPEPGTLPPGDYVVRAELDVPPLGEGWSARFEVDCTLTTAAGRELPRTHARTYAVHAVGGARGYRLEPLYRVHVPDPDGTRTCTFRLVPVRPDGVEQEPWTGRYRTAPPR